MRAIPNIEPSELDAGTSWAWDREFPGYSPADGWVLSYALRGPDSLDLGGPEITPAGSRFQVRVPADKTTILPGAYRWAAYLAKEGERHLAAKGDLTITADLATVDDGRTFAERMVATLEETIEARVKLDQKSWTRGQRAAHREELEELQRQLGIWQSRVNAERRRSPFQQVEVRFGRP